MVSLTTVRTSNAAALAAQPSHTVSVWIGATSGIGRASLLHYCTLARQPKIYLVGRNASAAVEILDSCKASAPGGEFVWIQSDMGLLRNVEKVCKHIAAKEKTIDLLFLSAGAPSLDRSVNEENIHTLLAAAFYGRLLTTQLLLPQLSAGPRPGRVVNVAGGSKEGPLYPNDWAALRIPFPKLRGHIITMSTLSFEALAAQTSGKVSMVHAYPGTVDTPLTDNLPGALGVLLRIVITLFGWLICVPLEECGERMVYLATADRYQVDSGEGRCSDGKKAAEGGNGVFSVNWDGESAGSKVEKLLDGYRKDGMAGSVWNHVDGEFVRVRETGRAGE